ncbi:MULTISPECIES: DUF4112 domain-containing protein [Pacificimonas]|uniref:DUF4112 domain-containing protein n=1 Tax=Pacificimonas TaxID=1960290 RepID=UPI001CC9F377|nr:MULTISPECIES: DUF4112 domain-containing protein [Pacificimonas]
MAKGARSFSVNQEALQAALSEVGEDARSPTAVRRRLEVLETVLEKSIRLPARLPVVGDRVGLDAVLGFIPVIGDIIGGLLGSYLIWEARNLGMSKFQLARMAANTGFDTVIGFVPLVGDVIDIGFKSNSRNMRIIRKYLDKHHPETGIIEADPV